MSNNTSDNNSYYSDDNSGYILPNEIRKETFTKLTIESKLYNRLVGSLDQFVSTTASIRTQMNKTFFTRDTQTCGEDIGLNSTTKLLENITEDSEETKEIKRLKTTIDLIRYESEKELRSKNQIIQQYEKEIKTLKRTITELKEDIIELKNYRNANELQKLQLNNQRNVKEIVFHTSKAILTISSYLTNNEILPLAQANKTVYNCLFFKAKDQLLMNKLKQRDIILNTVIAPDTGLTYDLTEETIEELIDKYIVKAYLPGTCLRNRIVHSLLFIENKIRNPLREIYNDQDTNNIKAKGVLKNAFSSFVSIIQGDADFRLEDNANDAIESYLSLPNSNGNTNSNDTSNVSLSTYNSTNSLKQNDKDIIQICSKDEHLNVLFEFSSAEQIKELLEYFFKAKLNKSAYAKFLSSIVEQYSKLLYSCYTSLKEIKELEIVNHAINSRFRRYKFLCQEMQVELNDLNKFAKSSKEIKDILLKQKNSVEIKYNDSRLEITHLLVEKGRHEKKINQLTEELEKNKSSYEAFKDKLVKEYKIILADYNNTKKERELLRKIIIDFKNYFMNYVSTEGEISS